MYFTMYTDVLSLTDLACYRVAVSFWRSEIIDLPWRGGLPSPDDVVENCNIKNNPSIPSRLRDIIVKCIPKIEENLDAWKEMLDSHLPLPKNSTWIKYFDDLVWSAENYNIDFLKTCHNLLRSDRLENYEKFTLACCFSLENEIRNLWPDPDLPDNISKLNNTITTGSWLLSYWISRLMPNRNEDQIFSKYYDEEYIIYAYPTPNLWTIEYFWPHMSLEGQIQIFINYLGSLEYSNSLTQLLPKLSEPLLQRILPKVGSRLMIWLILDEKAQPLVTMSFWNYVKHIFDSGQFFKLVEWMLLCEMEQGSRLFYEEDTSLCQQIWHCAPQHLKEHALNVLSSDYKFPDSEVCTLPDRFRSATLLKMVLSEGTPAQRYRIWTWKDNWINFCMHRKKSDMDRLFELCIPDADKRKEFKRGLDVAEDEIFVCCSFLIESLESDKLDDLTEFCSISLDASVELKQNVVQDYVFEMFLRDVPPQKRLKNIDSIITTIDGCFSNPVQSACFKKKIISSHEYLGYTLGLLREGNFAPIKKLVTACLPGEQEMMQWVEHLGHYCQRDLNNEPFFDFYSSQWENFLMYVLGSEKKVKQFKRSLDVDGALSQFLQGCETRRETRRRCEAFGDFLKWSRDSKDLAALKRKYIETDSNNVGILDLLLGGKRKRCE